MIHSRFSLFVLITMMLLFSLIFSIPLYPGFTFITYPNYPFIVGSGQIFNTLIDLESWGSNCSGAFSIILSYDPNVIKFRDIFVPSGSVFEENIFFDVSNNEIGETKIIAFQPSNSISQTYTVFVNWAAIGASGTQSQINLSVESTIDFNWKPVNNVFICDSTLVNIVGQYTLSTNWELF